MRIRYLVPAISALLLFGAGIAWTQLRGSVKKDPLAEVANEESPKTAPGTVVLGDEKLASMDIRVEPAERRSLTDIHVVPGRIQYDDAHRVDLRAAASGIVVEVRVLPGDHVSAGQVLAVLSSPEIGLARTEVHHARESWDLAAKKNEWTEETAKNVTDLLEGLKNRVAMNELEKRFRGKTLGKYREQLLAAYVRFLLAENLAQNADRIGREVLPAVTLAERRAERQSSEAALRGACEQAGFDIGQQKKTADIDAGDALRRLHIAQQQRTALLGYSPDTVPEDATAGDELSRVEIRAPFAGTIEEKHAAQADRVRLSDEVFVLADTRSLWVVADIREQDWLALTLARGEELAVSTPAIPGSTLKARVERTGRRVSAETNSVSLVATLDNASGLLRPGLFVHVSIPIGPARNVVSTAAAAVVEHEGTKFVFVQTGPKTFRRADVETGLVTDKRIEIVKGVAAGEPVVVEGAMALKSEMLVPTLSKED